MSFDEVKGVDVLQDWDNFFANKMSDYYTVKEEVVGEWFSLEGGQIKAEIISQQSAVEQAVNASKLPLALFGSKKPIKVIGVVTGPGIMGNPYELDDVKVFIVDVFNKETNLFYTAQELIAFANTVSINPYGKTFTAGPIVGLIDFKAAIEAVKNLPDGADTDGVENDVLSSLDMLLHSPSLINDTVDKQGLLFAGLFGYTFNYN